MAVLYSACSRAKAEEASLLPLHAARHVTALTPVCGALLQQLAVEQVPINFKMPLHGSSH